MITYHLRTLTYVALVVLLSTNRRVRHIATRFYKTGSKALGMHPSIHCNIRKNLLNGSKADGRAVRRADIISTLPNVTEGKMAKNDTLEKVTITSFQ
jgi:hypothetical protein